MDKMDNLAKDLIKSVQVAEKIRADVMSIETPEAFISMIGAIIDEWTVRHNMNSADLLEQLVMVSIMVNKDLGPFVVKEEE